MDRAVRRMRSWPPKNGIVPATPEEVRTVAPPRAHFYYVRANDEDSTLDPHGPSARDPGMITVDHKFTARGSLPLHVRNARRTGE